MSGTILCHSVTEADRKVESLQSNEAEIVRSLEGADLKRFARRCAEIGVIPDIVKTSFDALVPSTPRPSKVRYLLQHVNKKLKYYDSTLFGGFINVLAELKVSRDVLDKVTSRGQTATKSSKSRPEQPLLGESRVNSLAEKLASCSGKWYEIGSTLNLHDHVLENIRVKYMFIHGPSMCWSKVLREWVVGGHEHAKPPTIENLQRALQSQRVGHGREANMLEQEKALPNDPSKLHTSPPQRSSDHPPTFKIVSQSQNMVIKEGRTVLLEVVVENSITKILNSNGTLLLHALTLTCQFCVFMMLVWLLKVFIFVK